MKVDALSRRSFVRETSVALAALATGCLKAGDPSGLTGIGSPALQSRPGTPTGTVTAGLQPLGMADDNGKDGFLYVPPTYLPSKPTPLLVLLHGAGFRSTEWSAGPLSSMFDNPAMIVVGPDSRGPTWDLTLGGFGPDVKFIDAALALAFKKCNVDPNLVALGGFSDGGSYALSLGVGNGDLFSALMAFSPGFYAPARRQGKPRIFVQHGTRDTILPIDAASRTIVPILKNEGYSVRYDEFDGIHTFTTEEVTKAVRWFVPA